MSELHKLAEWEGIEHKLRRPPWGPNDQGKLRQLFLVARDLHDHHTVLKEGLSIGDYPYAPGVDRNTAPPPDKVTIIGASTYKKCMAQGCLASPTQV